MKIVEITTCVDCQNYFVDIAHGRMCNKTRNRLDRNTPIPDWCPLEDASKKTESACHCAGNQGGPCSSCSDDPTCKEVSCGSNKNGQCKFYRYCLRRITKITVHHDSK